LSQGADGAGRTVVVIIERFGEHFDKWDVAPILPSTLKRCRVSGQDLLASLK
jgi:hypothetical protein